MLRSMILRNHGCHRYDELSAENRQLFDSMSGHPHKFFLWMRIAGALTLALLLFCLLVTLYVVFLVFTVRMNPSISAQLDKFHLFAAGLIPLTAGLLLFWVLILAFAACYQIEYKKIFHKYFTGRDLRRR